MTQICADNDTYLCHLSIAEQEDVFGLTADLCAAHEKQAFLESVHVGMRLFGEPNSIAGEGSSAAGS